MVVPGLLSLTTITNMAVWGAIIGYYTASVGGFIGVGDTLLAVLAAGLPLTVTATTTLFPFFPVGVAVPLTTALLLGPFGGNIVHAILAGFLILK